jgi:hypothetical protein
MTLYDKLNQIEKNVIDAKETADCFATGLAMGIFKIKHGCIKNMEKISIYCKELEDKIDEIIRLLGESCETDEEDESFPGLVELKVEIHLSEERTDE